MKEKIVFFFSRILLLSSVIAWQYILAYNISVTEFAYITFGFTMLNISMIAFTFGFNQFLMYQYSRDNTFGLNSLFANTFRIYILHSVLMIILLSIVMQFYEFKYMQYGYLFITIGLLLSFKDYLNIPNIINKNYMKISKSNFTISFVLYFIVMTTIIYPSFTYNYSIFYVLFVLLSISIYIFDLRMQVHVLSQNNFDSYKYILVKYKKSLAFGVSVFLFTIYYQLANILLPLLDTEEVVSTFGVSFIYLGIIYTLLNIVFNQLILPNMYREYKTDKITYASIFKKYRNLFIILGLLFSVFTASLSEFSRIGVEISFLEKYPLLLDGFIYLAFGIFARYTATVYSGDMNVIGAINVKIIVQVIVTFISIFITYNMIVNYSFVGACISYSITEILLLLGYLLVRRNFIEKT